MTRHIAELLVGVLVILSIAYALAAAPVHATECSGRVVMASWYGLESGSTTAKGEHFTGRDMTAAMPSRQHLGEHYRVTYLRTGLKAQVRINDVGPAARTRRGIDLSEAVARQIGMLDDGIGKVCIERLR